MLRTRQYTFGPNWSPWRDFARMQADMDRLFHLNDSYPPGFPPMNVWTNEDQAVVSVELPGVEPDQVDISVLGDTLTIKGTRKEDEMPEGAIAHRRERGTGEFSRSVRLPFPVEAGAVDAKFEHGILEVRLPRAEADRPRRITVQHA